MSARHIRELAAIEDARNIRTPVSDEVIAVSGLSAVLVNERLSLGLANVVNENSSRSLVSILRSNLLTLFNAVVGGSFVLLLVLGQWKDALFGFAVVANVLIGIIQEFNSKRTLDRIAIMNQPRARVLRDEDEFEIPVADVVLDDALVLRAGDQIPADAIVLNASELEVDESLLTGESDAIEKSAGDALLSGSTVVSGSATARTVKVGRESYSNAISREARRFSLVKSELRNALSRIVRWISWALIPLMAIALNGQMQAVGGWASAFSSGAWVGAVVSSIASIISMIPQGLVLITSITFAIAAVGLARKKVLVQELPAVEVLARVDVVCFDKTGTLTEGEIAFSALEFVEGSSETGASRALSFIAHARDANATAQALRCRFSADASDSPVLESVVFNSTRKWSALSFEPGQWWIFGAPDVLLAAIPTVGKEVAERIAALSAQGSRTLLLVRSDYPIDPSAPQLPTSGTPACIVTFDEKIRSDAAETIAYFASQGLQLKVISGDNPQTVAAVAKRAGIVGADAPQDARLLPSEHEALTEIVESHTVFGRVTPEQKKRIVLALQSRGHVVAMTGDGVNDALALKSADLGIAMGNGSAATKAVSRIVLLNNAFDMLPRVVGEGRRVIANVERVSRLFLTKTTWAMMLAIVFGSLLWSFPFLPRQLSGVDGYTIGFASFLLALLPNNRRYLAGFLRRSLMYCIPSGAVIALVVIAFTAWARPMDYSLAQTQTAVAIMLSLTGLWVLVTLSRPYDKWKWLITGAMYAMFIVVFVTPFIRDFFGFSVMPVELLMVTIGLAAIACALLELINRVVLKLVTRQQSLHYRY